MILEVSNETREAWVIPLQILSGVIWNDETFIPHAIPKLFSLS